MNDTAGTIILRGSWGELKVHRETGYIVEYDDYGKKCGKSDDEGYHDIALIDPRTLIDPSLDRFGEADILSAGFWTKDGAYVTPMTWVNDAWERDGEVEGDWLTLLLLAA